MFDTFDFNACRTGKFGIKTREFYIEMFLF